MQEKNQDPISSQLTKTGKLRKRKPKTKKQRQILVLKVVKQI